MGQSFFFADMDGKHLLKVGKLREVPDELWDGDLSVETMANLQVEEEGDRYWYNFAAEWQRTVCEGRHIQFYGEWIEEEESCPWFGNFRRTKDGELTQLLPDWTITRHWKDKANESVFLL